MKIRKIVMISLLIFLVTNICYAKISTEGYGKYSSNDFTGFNHFEDDGTYRAATIFLRGYGDSYKIQIESTITYVMPFNYFIELSIGDNFYPFALPPGEQIQTIIPMGNKKITHVIFQVPISQAIVDIIKDCPNDTPIKIKMFPQNRPEITANVSLEIVKEWKELISGQAPEWFNKGYDYYEKKDYENAILAYNKGIELNSQDAVAYHNRGSAYYCKEQYDLAIKDYNKAIELNPQFAEAYNIRGNAYYSKGQYDLAIKDYNKTIELKPQYAYAYYGKGDALRQLGKNIKAIECFNKFIQYATPGGQWIEKAKQRIRELGGTI